MEKIKVVLDMANNHCKSVEKGKQIIDQHSNYIDKFKDNFEFYLKFQYRDIDGGFIHPNYKEDFSFKYIKRFSETKLTYDEFFELKKYAEEKGFKTLVTPFDESSVQVMVNQKYDIIKVASCSAGDYPLLEKIAETKLPVILSTAGISFSDLDNVVRFFENRKINLSIMHCIARYPSYWGDLELNQITLLKERYPNHDVGFSTHEEPDNYEAVKIAYGQGARLFERHIDLDVPEINKYSSTPNHIDNWLSSLLDTIKMCGREKERYEFSEKELQSLHGLRRGVFVNKDIDVNTVIKPEDVYFAIPLINNNHYSANDFSKYKEFKSCGFIKKDSAITEDNVFVADKKDCILEKVKKVIPLIQDSGIALPDTFNLQFSHHYGLDKFEEVGAYIIDILNTENYCKKYIIMLSNQFHPNHSHLRKTETFLILYGSMICNLDGEDVYLKTGDMLTVEIGQIHSFETNKGVIFEEISTQHFFDDSYYLDKNIIENKDRKTNITLTKEFFKKFV